MLKDFEAIKSQLAELADIINKFKSEAVQLRIVELVLRGQSSSSATESEDTIPPQRASRRKERGAKKKPDQVADGGRSAKKKASSGDGAIATLTKVYQEGFFKSPRTIKDILAHCETNLARRIKANEISGKLARMVRSGELKRAKNADGQYEYTNP
ncbi:MAG TPA: hypothetical protein VF200_06210 [Woeseiaceae bacterium]